MQWHSIVPSQWHIDPVKYGQNVNVQLSMRHENEQKKTSMEYFRMLFFLLCSFWECACTSSDPNGPAERSAKSGNFTKNFLSLNSFYSNSFFIQMYAHLWLAIAFSIQLLLLWCFASSMERVFSIVLQNTMERERSGHELLSSLTHWRSSDEMKPRREKVS